MRPLFIGNSHAFYNALPFQVREMVRSLEIPCEVQVLTMGGVSLAWHAKQRGTMATIRYGGWTHIVLQQKSHPFPGEERLLADLETLRPHLEHSGAKILLYGIWPEEAKPENRTVIDNALVAASSRFGYPIVPVSSAWHLCEGGAPEIDLYDTDGEHASPAGSYLAACVFAGYLTAQSPVGLPGRIELNGDVLADIAPETARHLREAARQVLSPINFRPNSTAIAQDSACLERPLPFPKGRGEG